MVTLVFGLLSFGLMPAGPTQTASWFRGKKGWFTARYDTPKAFLMCWTDSEQR